MVWDIIVIVGVIVFFVYAEIQLSILEKRLKELEEMTDE